MIKTKYGDIEVAGTLEEISGDVVCILQEYRDILKEEFDEKGADFMFAEIGRMACMTRDEILSEDSLEDVKKRMMETFK